MGRYYEGDINGKFWFAVQSSTDAEFFGAEPMSPPYVDFYFHEDDHIDDIKNGIKTCEDKLGLFKAKLDEFFESHNGYNDKQLMEFLEIKDIGILRTTLEWYARLRLGNKILACVLDQGDCEFRAEL